MHMHMHIQLIVLVTKIPFPTFLTIKTDNESSHYYYSILSSLAVIFFDIH